MSLDGGASATAEVTRVESGLDPDAPPDYRALAARLAVAWSRTRPRRVGIGGGQGAGKSTLGRLIEASCAAVGLRAAVIGIDDFYCTRAERQRLGERIHPLFETRGPPGTHDVEALGTALDALLRSGDVVLPCFDKGLDDRSGSRCLEGPFDLVVLEGWCVGARPTRVSADATPINDLERELDPEGRWRAEVDARLARDYQPLWERLDELVFLAVPGLDAVRRWRLEQEASLPEVLRLDSAAVDRFVQHYERVTLSMLADLPDRADWVVSLAEDHSVARIVRRGGEDA